MLHFSLMQDRNKNQKPQTWENVDWDLPDAEIARNVGLSRERVRQVRKKFEIPRARLFRVRMTSLEKEEKLRRMWKPTMTISDAANFLETSYSNAYRLLKLYNLSFIDTRKLGYIKNPRKSKSLQTA